MDLDWVTSHRYEVLNSMMMSGWITIAEISEDTGCKPPQIHTSLKKLKEKELVERDNERKMYRLTEKGEQSLNILRRMKDVEKQAGRA